MFFLAGSGLFLLGSFGAGFSATIEVLVFFRAIQAIGCAGLITLSPVLIGEIFPDQGQDKAISVYSAVTGLGLALGPVLGGLIVHYWSWQWVFFVNLPVGLLGFLLCSSSLNASERKARTIDWLSVLLLTLAAGGLVYGLIATAHGVDGETLVYLALGGIALVGLLFRSRSLPDPLMSLALFREHHGIILFLLVIIVPGLINVVIFFSPLFLNQILHLSSQKVGFIMAVIPSMQIVLSFFASRLVKFLGLSQYVLVAIGFACMAALVMRSWQIDQTLLPVILAFSCTGIAWGAANTAAVKGLNQYFKGQGLVAGTLYTYWNFASALLLALCVTIYVQAEQSTLHHLLKTTQQHLSQYDRNLLLNTFSLSNTKHAISGLAADHQVVKFAEQVFISGFHSMLNWLSVVLLSGGLVGFFLYRLWGNSSELR